MTFGCNGRGLANGGDVTPFVDSEKAGQGRVDATQPMVFSATRPPTSAVTVPPRETTTRRRTARSPDDHPITPEERLRIAMAKQ